MISTSRNNLVSENNSTKTDIILIRKNNNANQSKELIKCPQCHNLCIINFKDYKINLDNCGNSEHINNNIQLDDFNEMQKKKKECNECGKSKSSQYYISKDSGKIICENCKDKHETIEKMIEFESIYFSCIKHEQEFKYYCQDCKKNMCENCKNEENGQNHKIIELKKMVTNIEDIDQLKEKIDKFKDEINGIIDMLNKVINNIDAYFEINNIINENSQINKYNYKILKNVEILNNYNKTVINDIDSIISEKAVESKFKKIKKIYDKMRNDNSHISRNRNNNDQNIHTSSNEMIISDINEAANIEQIIIKLKFKEDYINKKSISVFGEKFVENNSNLLMKIGEIPNNNNDIIISVRNNIDIENTWIKIAKEIVSNNINRDEKGIIINLKGINDINDLSYMFSDCSDIISVEFLSDIETEKIINMSNMFSKCNFLKEVLNLSNLDASNVISMSGMFSNCSSLETVPDISKWKNKTKNLLDISYMFLNCTSLTDISKLAPLNTSNVSDMSGIFFNCKSLKSLYEISSWDISNTRNMSNMFNGCNNLEDLSEISDWNTSKVEVMTGLFNKCESLKNLSKISKWNTSFVTKMNELFSGCVSLEDQDISEIKNWDVSKVTKMGYMFSGCKKIKDVQPLSNWKISNVIEMNNMFEECESLEILCDFPSDKTINVTNISFMFYECSKLETLPDTFEFNNKKITDMSYMFYNCRLIEEKKANKILKIERFKKADKEEIFSGCKSSCLII